MSLVSQAIIAITHYVLDGRTWAYDRIREQPVDPIGDLLRGAGAAQKPVLAVYVESAKMDVTGRETQGRSGELELKVFVYVAPGRTELPEGTQFELDGEQAGLTLNIVGRQVDAALHFGNTDWIAIWRRFVAKISERSIRYMLVEVENAVKIPTMEITYRLTSIPDPLFGKTIEGAWLAFDTKMRAVGGDLVMLADLIKGMIENPADLPDYQDLQLNFGLTDAALHATGLAPLQGATDPETGEPIELEEVGLDLDTVIVPEDEE